MSRKTLRILLLEDDHEDAFLFRKRCPDHVLTHVTSVSSGLVALQETAFDLCFVDYRLGAESGLDFVRAARERHPGLPLIVITGQQIEVLGENALLAGATDFVAKDDLDTVTIDRAIRWSLIRRHVELRRESQADAALISRLMGREPVTTTTARTGEPLRRLLYLSLATHEVEVPELIEMSAQFAAANARLGVTGVLVYADRRFLQAIEGPDPAIECLLQKIKADPRHGQMQVIIDEPSRARLFAEWKMGLIRTAELSADAGAADPSREMAARIRALIGDTLSRDGIENLLRGRTRFVAGSSSA